MPSTHRRTAQLTLAFALLLGVVSCAAPAAQPPAEVTRLVEVTRVVEVIRPVVETQIVEVTRVAPPAPATPAPATPAPAKTSPALQPEAVIAAFRAAGLEAEQPRPLTKDDYGLAPLVGSGLRFTIPSLCADCGGRIFIVEAAGDRQRLKTYYQEMSKASAMAFSWIFERSPILVQINGDLPEAQARKYEAALQSAP